MKPVDLAVVIPTVNRSPKPNYLKQTLDSIARSVEGQDSSNVRIFIVDSGPGFNNKLEYPEHSLKFPVDFRVYRYSQYRSLLPYENIVECLNIGHKYARKWMLLLEDDVIVCKDFFGSVLRWLDGPINVHTQVFAFGSAHPNIKLGLEAGFDGIRIPAHEFYGTQAIAMRPETALAIARHLESSSHCKERPGEYDLAIADWVREAHPEYPYIVASCPSFVQHIGRESSIRDNGLFFEFDSFRGENWTYEVEL